MIHINKVTIRDWKFSFLFSVLFVSFFSLSTTPFFHFTSLDSEIFQEMGMALLKGKVLYLDLFDHKGCILFFINAIGIFLNKEYGIIVFQILNLSIILFYLMRIVRIISHENSEILFLFSLFFILESYYEEGNLSEEWSLIFITIPVYWCVKAIEENARPTIVQLFQMGLCLGVVAFIRVNNIILILGYLIYFLLLAIKIKDFSYIIRGIFALFVGFLLPTFACVLYFYYRKGLDGIEGLILGTFLFNLEYATKYNSSLSLPLYFKIISYAPIVLLILLSLLCSAQRKHVLPLVLSYIIGLLCVGQTLFRHYFLVFLPLFAVTWGLIGMFKHKIFYRVVILLTFIGASMNPLKRYAEHFMNGQEESVKLRCNQFKEMIAKIPLEQRNDIWNYNGQEAMDAIVDADIVQCNRIIIPFHLDISETLSDQEKNILQEKKPRWILVNRKYKITNVSDNLFIKHLYVPVDSTRVKGLENVVLLRRVKD